MAATNGLWNSYALFLAGSTSAAWIANERVRTIRDLKGRTVAISAFRDAPHVLVASIAAHVGLKPEKDIN